jgi:hypothetical protein
MSNAKEPYLTNASDAARNVTIGGFQQFSLVPQNMSSPNRAKTISIDQLEDLLRVQYQYLPQISTKIHTGSWNYDWKRADRNRDAKKACYPSDHKSGVIRKENLSSTWIKEYEGLHTLPSLVTSKQLSKTEKTGNGGNLPKTDLIGWWRCCQCSQEINPRLYDQNCSDCDHGRCDWFCTEL